MDISQRLPARSDDQEAPVDDLCVGRKVGQTILHEEKVYSSYL